MLDNIFPSLSQVTFFSTPTVIQIQHLGAAVHGAAEGEDDVTKELVFHKTLSILKSAIASGVHRAHSKGKPERSTFFPRI